jgi:biopolymer transport protein ExbD
MAAMLDMAFQLLAFFILTFKPSEIEAQVSMRMPKERTVTQGSSASVDLKEQEELESFDFPLDVKVIADPDGGIARVEVGANIFSDSSKVGFFPSVAAMIANIVGMPGCDGVRISVSESLKYENLMKVVDICAQQPLPSGDGMKKISISTIK